MDNTTIRKNDMFSSILLEKAQVLLTHCTQHALTLGVAESCTGGLLGGLITSINGSSTVFQGGIIAYSDTVKHHLLGVPTDVLRKNGAVSAIVAHHMALGAMERLDTSLALSITGIAGPNGGSDTKPIGLVFIAKATVHGVVTQEHFFKGDRMAIRLEATLAAMTLALS
jgi:PncC family amidohydrolase